MDILEIDLVNCHHPKYYAGKKKESSDDESPNPQFFPVVKKGTDFSFSLVPVRPNADLKKAKEWLIKALAVHGAGAKTSAGYGWFDCTDSSTVVPNQSLFDDWVRLYSSFNQYRKGFLQLPEIKNRTGLPELLRTAVKFIRTRPWWEKEQKNQNGASARFVSEMIQKFKWGDSE